MRDSFTHLRNFVRGAWRELPLESLAVITAAVSSIALVHSDTAGGRDAVDIWLVRLILAALLATPLCFALSGLHRRRLITRSTQLVIGSILSVGVVIVLSVAIRDSEDLDADWFAWPYGLSLLAAVLVPFITSVIGRDSAAPHTVPDTGPSDQDRLVLFTRFMRRFFEQTTTWGLLWLASMAAVAVVFVALDELFELSVDRLGVDTALIVTGLLVLTYLYRLLQYQGPAEQGRLPELWRRLATTVGAPFVSVMLLILLVYETIILFRGELPKNILSPLIIAAGFVGFLCTLIIMSLLRESVGTKTMAPAETHRWARRGSVRIARAFPPILLLLLPVAGWALMVRVEQYGFTPFRVVRGMALLCLAVMALLGTVRFLRRRAALTWEVPACVTAFALATAFGPVSAINLSLDSQIDRVQRMFTEAGVTGPIVAESVPHEHMILPYQQYEELRDGIQTIARLGGEEALQRLLSGNISECAGRWSGWDCLAHLGIGQGPYDGIRYHTAHAEGSVAVPAGNLVFIDLYRENSFDVGLYQLRLMERSVAVYRGAELIAQHHFDDIIATWEDTDKLATQSIALPRIAADTDTTQSQDIVGYLVLQRVGFHSAEDRPAELTQLSGVWISQ